MELGTVTVYMWKPKTVTEVKVNVERAGTDLVGALYCPSKIPPNIYKFTKKSTRSLSLFRSLRSVLPPSDIMITRPDVLRLQ